MNAIPGAIRTPDQRLRVFVSSTLKELAAERRSARIAIEGLHLAPVMFELGARPHPPRELYRAYLEQSDVFVGLYWERYGWVAPGESVSGLEDEYRLAPALPKLIYIKEPSGSREPRLGDLLNRIRDDDTASFKYFSDADELGGLLQADLATLLAERFDQSRISRVEVAPAKETTSEDTPTQLPSPLTELIGREREVQAIAGMLQRRSVRLVTLTGPGGIGKSRLSIAVASRVAPDYTGGVVFVDLAPVRDPALVPNAIAQALGVRDTGDGPLEHKLAMALKDRHMLVVLDNFEQVVGAAPTLLVLLGAAPGLSFLVTSRTLLRVSGERSFEVGPLPLPDLARPLSPADALALPSVELFVERVRAVKPDFELTVDNVDAVARICLALEGVPLAIELAAARARVLTPASILERLGRQLSLLVGGLRDLPERQQAVRNTIEWSTQLLGDNEKLLLAKLGVFAGGFSIEAVDYVWNDSGDADDDTDTLGLLGTLVENSLVRQQDRGTRPYFTMLATVREYAQEQLTANGTLEATSDRHARYYIKLGSDIETELKGPAQLELVTRLTDERDNLRAAVRFLLNRQEWDTAARFAWSLYIYWWVGGHEGEVRGWMEEVLAASSPVDKRTRAIALYFTRAITFWQDPEDRVVPGLSESADLFREAGDPSGEALALISLALALLAASTPDPAKAEEALETSLERFRSAGDSWGEQMALVTLGRVSLLQQKVHGALNRFEESLSKTRRRHDELGRTIALHHLGWAHLLLGEVDKAKEAFDDSLLASARLGHQEGVAYGLEGLVAIAATNGDVERAGRLFGAAQCLREQTGLYNAPTFSFHQGMVDQILATDAAAQFEEARREGRQLSQGAAVTYAEEVSA
jgi:predicted ATPase